MEVAEDDRVGEVEEVEEEEGPGSGHCPELAELLLHPKERVELALRGHRDEVLEGEQVAGPGAVGQDQRHVEVVRPPHILVEVEVEEEVEVQVEVQVEVEVEVHLVVCIDDPVVEQLHQHVLVVELGVGVDDDRLHPGGL